MKNGSLIKQNPEGILKQYVKSHNLCVDSGDFTSTFRLFSTDAEMIFENSKIGSFAGKGSIIEAFKRNPPGDKLIIPGVENKSASIIAKFAWLKHYNKEAGIIEIETEGRLIRK